MPTDIADFKKYIMTDVMPCPDPIVEREILGTIIEFCDKTHRLTREFNVTLDTDDIDSDYQDCIDIDLSEYLSNERIVSILGFTLDGVPMLPEYREIVAAIPDSQWESLHDDNTIYFSFPNDTTIRIYDRSTSDVYLYMSVAVKPLRSVDSVDDFFMEDYLDTIIHGAKFRIYSMPGKEWSDEKAAAKSYVMYKRGLSRAKSKVLKGFAQKSLEVHPKNFGEIDWNA